MAVVFADVCPACGAIVYVHPRPAGDTRPETRRAHFLGHPVALGRRGSRAWREWHAAPRPTWSWECGACDSVARR